MKLINLVRLSLALTFVVIMLGAYTRLADAGLGCPDWPGCYGHLTVPNEHHEIALAKTLYPSLTIEANKAWLEMIHRYFAGTLGLIIFLISFRCIREKSLGIGLPLTLSLVVVFQALLGMWTVTMKLMPIVVMGHLLGGFSLFCLLAILYWRLKDKSAPSAAALSVPKGAKGLAALALVVVVLQIALGGWTSSNYAALMCTRLPICQGDWTSYLDFSTAFELIQPQHESYEFGTLDYGARMTIHVTHRFGAILTTLVVIALAFQLLSAKSKVLVRTAVWLVALLTLQLLLGISNVVFSLPLVVAVAHNLGAALLLVTVLRANYVLFDRSTSRVTHSELLDKEGVR
ncbi:cytochrome B561 [Vibrio sinaloensis]|uniref:COX15/CtaA family protein n=1 Tax=Photobacterium sp. (strain ATCC 43367) TaxID=379097 RepID=UPI00057F0BB3|nr:COX15/CtaA family protein [Vibrio sinaloensis]KIE21746.1 cytochrome B561 [Vibrio sinaloensis]